jgi:hypothetical protein
MRKGSDLTKPLLPNVSPSVGPTGGDLFPEEKRVPLNAQCLLHLPRCQSPIGGGLGDQTIGERTACGLRAARAVDRVVEVALSVNIRSHSAGVPIDTMMVRELSKLGHRFETPRGRPRLRSSNRSQDKFPRFDGPIRFECSAVRRALQD